MGYTPSMLFTHSIPHPLETTPVCPEDSRNLTKDIGTLNWSVWGSQDLDPGERQTASFTPVYIFFSSKAEGSELSADVHSALSQD